MSKNQAIFDELSKKVIGHDKAKKVLINLINRSKLRYYQKWGLLESSEIIPLSNCLLVGDSGTGKTFLVESLAEVMQFPLIKIDATELNPTGASGGLKQKDVVRKITDKAKEVIRDYPDIYWSYEGALDQVVVFVDEIDKLGQQLSSDWNSHVQANFLSLFENKGELSGITFIFAGAFAKMDKEESSKTSIGFYKTNLNKLGNEDLAQKIIKFGLLPELVGRMHNIVQLDILKEKDYKKILLEQLLPKIKTHLEFFGVQNFQLTANQITMLIKESLGSGLGIRALQTGLNDLLIDIEFAPESYL